MLSEGFRERPFSSSQTWLLVVPARAATSSSDSRNSALRLAMKAAMCATISSNTLFMVLAVGVVAMVVGLVWF